MCILLYATAYETALEEKTWNVSNFGREVLNNFISNLAHGSSGIDAFWLYEFLFLFPYHALNVSD